jgi:di/tricarboxylate transporter
MTPEMIITLIIILTAVILLATNRLRPDLVALIVLVALGLSGVVDEGKIFSGFSSPAIITILAISMVSIGLQRTGATNAIGKFLYRIGGQREPVLIFLVALTSAVLSLFMNNIAAVGVLLPAVMTLSRKSRVSPSRLLMPLAFGTILGGMATLLTTSNIIVSGALQEAGYKPFGLLDYFPIGGPVALIGIIYLATLGKKLLPSTGAKQKTTTDFEFTDRLIHLYQVEKNLSRITLHADSPMAGISIENGDWSNRYNLNILAVLRKNEENFSPDPAMELRPGDVLIAQGKLDSLIADGLKVSVENVSESDTQFTDEAHPLAEIIISPHSRLIGRTIKDVKFRDSYSLNVVGVWRGGKPLHSGYAGISLQFGDALLVQGPASQIHNLQENADLVLLDEDPDAVMFPKKGIVTLIITLVTLTIAALGILPVPLVVLAGALLLLLTGSLDMNEAFHSIEWKAIFLIAGLWPLSYALQDTGLANLITHSLLKLTSNISPLGISALLLLIAMLLTLLMGGQVSAIVTIPLALSMAKISGIDPRPLSMAVAMGCNLAFLTPLGHPVNVMVMNPGNYKFKDYFRMGLPLTIVAFAGILLGIHLLWGL